MLRHVAAREDGRVQIACAGVQGAIALEDVYVAGRLSAGLPGRRSDAALAAEAAGRLAGPGTARAWAPAPAQPDCAPPH